MLGGEIGRGVRSVVFAFGEREVVKVPNPDVPRPWLIEESRLTTAVAHAGAPVAGPVRLLEIEGRLALASERVDGRSMWERLLAEPALAPVLAADLVRIQVELSRLTVSFEMPAQRDRIGGKVHVAASRHGDDLLAALDLLPPDTGPLVLCHGDLHPRNVLLAPGRTVLVDWFDACRGAIEGEIARTLVMLEDDGEIGGAVADFPAHYLDAACDGAGVGPADLEPWLVVHRVARLAEGFGLDRVHELRARVGGR